MRLVSVVRPVLWLGWVVLLGGVPDAAAQGVRRPMPDLGLESLTGRDSFERYCASCHGVDGKGRGAVASALQQSPADLTALARRNGGTFPRAEVRAYIDGTGRAVPAHGTRTMPVWGAAFPALDRSPERAAVRIDNLVGYLASLQAPAAAPPPRGAADQRAQGAQLFRTHCAVCHGENARGNGPMAGVMRRPPVDLTRYTSRNGGVFPSEELRRVIDGRNVPSHGPGEMPVWGDVFRRVTGDSGQAQARIDALVVFLQSIQSRATE